MGAPFFAPLERRCFLSVSAHIRLLDNETTIQAGESIHVSAMPTKTGQGTSFGTGEAITSQIQWNFGDKNGQYDHLSGFNAAHVYNKSGKYKITLRVTNAQGQSDTTSRVITVTQAARKVIYVNPFGSDKNNGRTPGKAVATISRAMQLMTSNTDLYFRAGQKYKVTGPIRLPFSNVQIGSYGSGKTPQLQLQSGTEFQPVFFLSGKSHQVTIENLTIKALGSSMFGYGVVGGGSNIVLKGLTFANLEGAIMNVNSPVGLLAMNNYAGVLKGYFAYVNGSDQVYLGNVAGDSTTQHNIRIYGSRILCYGNDLTNYAEGSSLATLRVNDGTDIYWSHNVLHGGQVYVGPLGPASAGSTANESVQNVVIEDNRWESVKGHPAYNDHFEINPGTENVMIRNNYIQATNSSAINVNTFETQTFSTGTVNRTVKNLQILSNTAINNGTTGAFLSVGGGQKNVITLKNSLYVAPNMDIGPFASAAVRVDGRSDLQNFTSLSSGGGIDGNVWNLPAEAKTMGVNYVSAVPAGQSAYRTPSEWESDFPKQVGDDSFEKITPGQLSMLGAPPPKSLAATFAQPAAGVFGDLLGDTRPTSGWTAGALQAAV